MKSFNARVLVFLCLTLILQLVIPWRDISAAGGKVSALSSLKVDFLYQGAEETNGYLPDYGELYGVRNGFSYGWSKKQSVSSVVYSTYGTPLENSFIRLQPDSVWEVELPNGNYDLTVAVGDEGQDSLNVLRVEDKVILDQVSVPAQGSFLASNTVEVKDGKLTLSVGDSSATTALQYIEISPGLSAKAVRQMISPRIALPAEGNEIESDQVILSGIQRNEHNRVPAIHVPGVQSVIQSYMSSQLAKLQAKWAPYEQNATTVSSDANALVNAINSSSEPEVMIRTGQLNLDKSVTFGSPAHPVFLVTGGINTNQNITITVYGTLIVKGEFNANTGVQMVILPPDQTQFAPGANLRVTGTVHLNNNSSLKVADELVVGSLIFNNGDLGINASRLIVENSLHINTKVDMNIEKEMLVGDLVSNNSTANIRVASGDFFVSKDVSVNNHLNIITSGVWAIGGDITSNQKPAVKSGGSGGQTTFKYVPYGLKAEYFAGKEFTGSQKTLLDANVDLEGKLPVNFPAPGVSVRWTGQVLAYTSELYEFISQANGGLRLWINDELLIDSWNQQGNGSQQGEIRLEKGRFYNIRVEFESDNNQPKAILSWRSSSVPEEIVPQGQLSPFAVPELSFTPSASDISLNWTPSFNAEGYEVEADGKVIVLGNQNDYTHVPLDSGTLHNYRVRANAGPIHGEWSVLHGVWSLPAVPDNLQLSSTSSQIRLEWDSVTGANYYEIESNGTIINNGNSTEYIEKGLNPNMQRAFKVRAVNLSGPGGWSDVVARTTLPGTSGGLQALAKDTYIDVSWDSVSGAQWYDLEVDGASVKTFASEYKHANLQPNTSHTYRVRSGSALGNSEWSGVITVVTLLPIPHNVQATAGRDRIVVDWEPVIGATRYDIEVDGSIKENGTNISYIHEGLATNTEHAYKVRAVSGAVIGEWSERVVRTTLSDFPVNVQAAATDSQVELSWDPVTGAVGYDVEADGEIVHLGLDLSYVHAGLQSYTEHKYRVRARSAAGVSLWSDRVTAVTLLGIPDNFVITSTMNSIKLVWDQVAGATGYEVAVDGEIVDAGSATSYIHEGLTPNSIHIYRVRAKNEHVTGAWSRVLTQTVGLGIPVIKEAIPYSDKISLKWDLVEGATGYDLEIDGVVKDNGSSTTYVHYNLPSGAGYTFRVRAKNTTAQSGWSEPVTVRTTSEMVKFISSAATTSSILLEWTSAADISSYDLEVDGVVVSGIASASYTHKNLRSNTIHNYRVRAHSDNQNNEWSDPLQKKTITELIANVGKDNIFNFVVVAPPKSGTAGSIITISYNPGEVEVLDLSTVTPAAELTAGPVPTAGMSIRSVVPGKIVIVVTNSGATFVNGIRFLAKSNNSSSITYVVE